MLEQVKESGFVDDLYPQRLCLGQLASGGFSRNDLISFEEHDQNTVIIRHEKVCDGCGKLNLNEKKAVAKPTNEETLLDFVDSLSRDEQAAMLQHLCKLWLAAGETNA